MFQKGNKFGVGRPKISLSKPELLLPGVFLKANINWASDFTKLYKAMKDRAAQAPEYDYNATDVELKERYDPATIQKIKREQLRLKEEKKLLEFFIQFMPYLCTKVQLKEIDGRGTSSPASSVANANATSKLLQALEAENASTPKPPTESR